MDLILDMLLRQTMGTGRLAVRYPDGTVRHYGPAPRDRAARGARARAGGAADIEAAIVIRDAATVRRLAISPSLGFGEAYMSGALDIEAGSLADLVELLFVNARDNAGLGTVARARSRVRQLGKRLLQYNPAARSVRNVAHHYDLDGRLYSLFLDADRQYSCAYFRRGDETLEEAQAAKKRHVAAKLRLDRPGLEVLDIGSGWGGMAMTLARDYGARVTGITLSTEQLHASRRRAEEAGLADRVRFERLDYRALADGRDRPFDRIVSVGMFEHVGVTHYRTFFETVRRCLAPDGVALIHAIGRARGPGATNDWLAKYIFPGGYSPALSETLRAIEKSGLWVTDCETLRLHYAKTLRHWRERFTASRDRIRALYDERFCRMFELYLIGSELAFREEDHMNFQLQLSPRVGAMPLTRDYMFEAERAFEMQAEAATRGGRPDAVGDAGEDEVAQGQVQAQGLAQAADADQRAA